MDRGRRSRTSPPTQYMEPGYTAAYPEGRRPVTVDDLAQELGGMAASLHDIDPRAAERLEDLGASMLTDEGRLRWADVDLRRAFNTEMISLAYAIRREGGYVPESVDRADKIRNVLVLLPILLTWAALAEAANAYQRYITKNPDEIRKPFLLLWQEGFGGEAHWWSPSFSAVGFMDAAIIAIIIGLTLYSHGRREKQEENIQKTANLFQTELENVMAEATVALAPDRAGRPATLARAVDRMADRFDVASQELLTRLRVEHDRLDAIAARREREVGDLGAFVSGMRAGAEETQRTVVELRQVSRALQQAVEDMTSEVSLSVDQQRSLQGSIDGLERLVGQSVQSDRGVSQQLADAAQALAESADRAMAGADAAAQAGRTASEAVRYVAEIAATLATGQVRLEDALTGQTQSNQYLADSLRSGMGGLSTTSLAISEISQSLLGLRDDFGRMRELSSDQAVAMARMIADGGAMSEGLADVARSISEVGITTAQRQRELTDDLTRLVQQLDAVAAAFGRMSAALGDGTLPASGGAADPGHQNWPRRRDS